MASPRGAMRVVPAINEFELGAGSSPAARTPQDSPRSEGSPAANSWTGPPVAAEKSGVCVTFEQVGFALPPKKRKDGPMQILEDVSGYFAPGRLTAVMGPSGAGKTTLLDVVTGRKTHGTVSGSMLYDGRPASKFFLRHFTAYVEQFDTLLPVLTVRQMLMYQAALKCSRKESRKNKAGRVERLLLDLGLLECADTMIGDQLHPGISGGEAKRTNIGIALVTEPRILFLDEPTSGLDSQTSLDVVKILKTLVRQGRTVMTTIHSPSSEAFRLIDKLLLLVKGRTVYFGDLHPQAGGGKGAGIYMAGLGVVHDPAQNLADFLIASTGAKGPDVDFAGRWAASQEAQQAATETREILKGFDGKTGMADAELRKDVLQHNALTAVGVLLWHRTTRNARYPDFIMPRLAPSALFGLIIASLYWGIGEHAKDKDDVTARGNLAAALFMSTVMPSFSAAGYMPSIVQERPLFYRESADGCYTTGTYISFKMTEEAIPQVLASFIFCILTHYLIGYPGSFWWTWVINFMTSQVGLALAFVCGSVASNMDMANTLLSIYNVLGMFFTGVLFTFDEMPAGWKWYTWTNFVRYGWCANMYNNFQERCEEGDPLLETPACPLEYWGVDTGSAGSIGWNFLALTGFWFFWRLVLWLAMANVRFVKR